MRFLQRGLIFGLLAGLVMAFSWAQADHFPPLETMVGQMILLGFPGTAPDEAACLNVARQIQAGEVGGVLLLGSNFKTRTGVLGMTALFRSARGPLPVFIVVDMEGGLVQRLGPKLGYPKIPSAEKVATTMSPMEAQTVAVQIAQLVQEAGFNVNLGPVVDLGAEPRNPLFLQHRSYGGDPQRVADYARVFLSEHRRRGILTVLKHFPGHGSSLTDSHDDFVDISATWQRNELEPYRQLIGEGVARS
jgi:beta-N-acetylhexosaminidase